ncbi:CLUMA_CG020787, isoform A [Clunio marinus]|uniref:CLUMA_CG020787, isoform A n=1 Tax=Clunio marinus TaxID=568069 RepID=A0A1J1J9Y1_9DIPT|nr:CLUMA_CG020787, isoform A [Clunio marinus]
MANECTTHGEATYSSNHKERNKQTLEFPTSPLLQFLTKEKWDQLRSERKWSLIMDKLDGKCITMLHFDVI